MVILVLGPGRSGTSTVARILHNQLDVHMGDQFKPADESNPNGFWEDREFLGFNQDLLLGKMTYPSFDSRISRLIRKRNDEYETWGVKDPRLSYLLGCYIRHLESFRVVHCRRNNADVIQSCMKAYKWTYAAAEQMVMDRNRSIENYKHKIDMTEICFDTPMNDKAICEVLEPVVDLLNG